MYESLLPIPPPQRIIIIINQKLSAGHIRLNFIFLVPLLLVSDPWTAQKTCYIGGP